MLILLQSLQACQDTHKVYIVTQTHPSATSVSIPRTGSMKLSFQ